MGDFGGVEDFRFLEEGDFILSRLRTAYYSVELVIFVGVVLRGLAISALRRRKPRTTECDVLVWYGIFQKKCVVIYKCLSFF